MKIQIETKIKAHADRVWELLGPKFGEVHTWTSTVQDASLTGSGKNGAPSDGRVCQTSIGAVEETLVHYDDSSRQLAYTARAKSMPSFVKGLKNHWAVYPTNAGESRAVNILEVDISFPFNILMAPLMKMQMKGLIKTAHEELKYTAETGQVHPRKVEAIRKLKTAAA